MSALPVPLGQPDTPQSSLRVYLLGPPAVAWQGAVLTIPRRSVRALLYRLACEPKPVSRGHLHLLFWPDVPEAKARRNLSHLLTHLRRALPLSQLLMTTRDEIWLDPGQTWCDVLELRSAALNRATDLPFLHHLASLYRGPFLDGLNLPDCAEFEHWCIVERSALEHQYLKILELLVERCTSRGEISQAVKYAQQHLETDCLSEAMHRRLIQLYAASGDRHLALQQFERCSSILESDLGVDPLPETEAVYQAVLRGQLRFPGPPSPLPLPQLPGADAPLFGREEELRRLEDAFLGLQAQQGRVVLISGEPGIGKSRLMQAFAEGHEGEAYVLYGRGHAAEQTIPYRPILAVLRAILGLGETAAARQSTRASPALPGRPALDFVDTMWLSEVSRLLPEMHAVYPDLPLPLTVEPESAGTRLFDALCHLILDYARSRGRVLLCLDDLQWMDASTRAWLVHIGRFLGQDAYPLLILGTYRGEDAADLLDLRRTLARAGVLAELKLSGLAEADVLELLRHLVGPRAGDELLGSRLHQATGGNPFYLIETVHKLIEEGRLEDHFQEASHFPLSDTVRDAVQARLQRLSPIARQVLEAGAVLGQAFEFQLLRATAGRSHAEILSALDELVTRLLLVETPGQVRFLHDITRQHVEESLGQARRQALHRRGGRAYQRFHPDEFPALAHHFESGGDLPKAVDYHGRAARQAQTLFAWRTAEFHQERMLALLARIDPGCDRPDLVRLRAEILAERAHARYLQDRQAGRDADLAALAGLGQASDDDYVRLLALLNRLRYLNLDGDYVGAIAVAEEGLALLAASPSLARDADEVNVARPRLLAQLGFAYYFLGRPQEALAVLEEAWRLCGERADPEACGRILHILGYVHFHLGDNARALECQQRAYAYHSEAGDCNRMAWDLIDIGALHKNMGDLSAATRFLQEGLELACRVGSQQAKAHGMAHLGSMDLDGGDYAAAAAHYEVVLGIQQATHSEHVIATAEAGLGLALCHLGEYVQSRYWLERALQRARATGHRRRTAETLIQLGLLDLAEARLSLARRHLGEGLSVARDCQAGECLAAGLAGMAGLERRSGHLRRALALADEAVGIAQQIDLAGCQMWAEVEVGRVLLALGDLSSALEHTQRAVRLAPQAGQAWIGGEAACRVHALVLRALSQDEAAAVYERRAQDAIQAKAALIPDPTQRRTYRSRTDQP
ncbi:MAG: AAA family ATPase [Anaerolineae bacterium]|nr:AAA family ATPase [Anaerolineae bacterium]